MTIEIWEKTTLDTDKPVNGLVSVFVCLFFFTGSGMLAMWLSNPDQGKLVTPAEMAIQMQREAQRIEKDPHMPARAKQIALSLLSQGQKQGLVTKITRNR